MANTQLLSINIVVFLILLSPHTNGQGYTRIFIAISNGGRIRWVMIILYYGKICRFPYKIKYEISTCTIWKMSFIEQNKEDAEQYIEDNPITFTYISVYAYLSIHPSVYVYDRKISMPPGNGFGEWRFLLFIL